MTPSRGWTAALGLVLVGWGCGAHPRASDAPATAQSAPAPASAAPPAAPAPAAARVGDACEPGDDPGGSCGAPLLCMPAPGGYCTSFCGFGDGCPAGAACIPSPRAGRVCLASCAGAGDCREGYACDAVWKVCAPGGLLGPRPPSCLPGDAPNGALARRQAFGEARRLSRGASLGKYSFEPTGALLKNGDLVVVYTEMNRILEPNGLAAVVVRSDGSIDGPRALTSTKQRHFDPWMFAADDGVGLVWLGHDGGRPDRNPEIGFSTSADGVTWSPPRAVHDARTDCPGNAAGCLDKPMIARVADAWLVFYWSEVSEGLRAVRVADGAVASSVRAGAGAYGDVRVDERGHVHVVYQTFAPGAGRPDVFGDPRGRIEYVLSADRGKSFGKPLRVSAEGEGVPFFFSNPQVVSDTRRKLVHVLYPRGSADGRWDIVLATSKDGGKSWSRSRVNDDAPCANHMTPRAALDPKDGALHVIWRENRGGQGHMAYAVCRAGKCSENQAVHDAPFASYSFVRHGSDWVGEYDVLVLDARRRRLHAVWTQPVDEHGVATSRIFHATAAL